MRHGMRTRTTATVLAAVAVLVLVLAACGADQSASSVDEIGGSSSSTVGGSDGFVGAPEGPSVGEPGAGTTGGTTSGGVTGVALGVADSRKVVRTATLDVLVEDTATTIDDITRRVEAAGGFVANADLSRPREGAQLRGTLVLRVPSSDLGDVLTGIEGLAAEVRSKTLGSDDVTAEFVDIEARLRNLGRLEEEFLTLLTEIRENSASTEQLTHVFDRINQVRGEIEQLRGRQQALTELVALSTIRVSVSPVDDALPVVEEGWDAGRVVRSAARSTVLAAQGVANLVIWIVVTGLPVALLFVLGIGLPVWGLSKLAGAARRRLRDAMAPPPPPPPANA